MAQSEEYFVSLDGRTCLVTGASKGIGRSIAEDLGGSGAEIIVNYRSSEDAAYEVRDGIEERGGEAVVAQADVANLAEVDAPELVPRGLVHRLEIGRAHV